MVVLGWFGVIILLGYLVASFIVMVGHEEAKTRILGLVNFLLYLPAAIYILNQLV